MASEGFKDTVKIFIGNIIHCDKPFSLAPIENGLIVVKGSKILAVDVEHKKDEILKDHKIDAYEEVRLSSSQILIPGLIDTHIHAPQYPNVGLGYDMPLLDWLQNYTYVLESRYSDLEFSTKVYDAVVKKSISFGTTTACYFGSMFLKSSQTLVEAVITNGQRAFVGKVNMTLNAPSYYIETAEESIADTKAFIDFVRGKQTPLVEPIITPRFALSLDLETMRILGQLAKEYCCNIQSHISENPSEVELVNSTFECCYAEVYDKAGLLTKKTILAHGCYLTNEDLCILASKETSISHCPSSNTRLQSGLCDVKRLIEKGINVGLGTDVSGGDSVSIIDAMRRAMDVSIHLSFNKTDYKPINCYDVFYMATLGGAKALNIEEKVGNFKIGLDFDAILVDIDVKGSPSDYINELGILELLQKFIYTGDDRSVKKVFVAGVQVK